MKKSLIFIAFILAVITSYAQPNPFGFYYPHKPYNDVKYIEALTLEGKAGYSRVNSNGNRSSNDLTELKPGFYREDFNRYLIKKGDNSFYIIDCNFYDHYYKDAEFKVEDFYFFSKNRKELKTVNEESLKPEINDLIKQATDVLRKQEDAKEEAETNALTESVKKYKSAAFDPIEGKKIVDLAKENILEKYGANYKVVKTYYWEKSYNINRNEYDRVLSKSMKVTLIVKNTTTNKCLYYYIEAGYEFDGGSYEKELRFIDGKYVGFYAENKYMELLPRTFYNVSTCEF